MAMTLAFPTTNTGLLRWSANALDLIERSPGSFGLVDSDVEAYRAAHLAFADGVALCAPAVRNRTAVVQKNENKAALKQAARLLASKIGSTTNVTDAQKVELGMPPRARPTMVPVPQSAPVIEVVSAMGCAVRIRLRDASGARRGRPAGTVGASIFAHVGNQAPATLSDWRFLRSVGRVITIDLQFDPTLAPGTQVFLTAFWFNGRKQAGAPSAPVAVNLPGGGVASAGSSLAIAA